MSKSAQEDSENITISELAATDGTLIQGDLIADSNPVSENYAEATETQSNSNESFLLLQDEIQMTLKEFNQKIDDNDNSIKRIEESMAALYDKLDRTPQAEESITSSKKKLKKKERKLDKKGKKERKLDKKGKKERKLDKKGKKERKLDKKGKKERKLDKKGKKAGRKNTKLTKAITSSEKKKTRRTSSKNKNNKGRNYLSHHGTS
jgi:chromosome segregation ATPase